MMNPDCKIFVAGHRGMVGSAIVRKLQHNGYTNIVTAGRRELDLTDQQQVQSFFKEAGIEQVYMAAAKVGGIHANNTYPAEFIYENIQMQTNIVHAAHLNGVDKLLFLGSSCIYPKQSPQPMAEDVLLTGVLEPTNEPYAIAKIAGIKLCESYNRQYGRDYRSVMPTNLYGPNDNFHPENSHVLPALIHRFHEAVQNKSEQVTVWGTGNAMREFLHVDDMADAGVCVMELSKEAYTKSTEAMASHINVGTGVDCTIRELAETISKVTGFQQELRFDKSKPDGTPRKLLNTKKLESLGWSAKISLESGVEDTYRWYVENIDGARVGDR